MTNNRKYRKPGVATRKRIGTTKSEGRKKLFQIMSRTGCYNEKQIKSTFRLADDMSEELERHSAE